MSFNGNVWCLQDPARCTCDDCEEWRHLHLTGGRYCVRNGYPFKEAFPSGYTPRYLPEEMPPKKGEQKDDKKGDKKRPHSPSPDDAPSPKKAKTRSEESDERYRWLMEYKQRNKNVKWSELTTAFNKRWDKNVKESSLKSGLSVWNKTNKAKLEAPAPVNASPAAEEEEWESDSREIDAEIIQDQLDGQSDSDESDEEDTQSQSETPKTQPVQNFGSAHAPSKSQEGGENSDDEFPPTPADCDVDWDRFPDISVVDRFLYNLRKPWLPQKQSMSLEKIAAEYKRRKLGKNMTGEGIRKRLNKLYAKMEARKGHNTSSSKQPNKTVCKD